MFLTNQKREKQNLKLKLSKTYFTYTMFNSLLGYNRQFIIEIEIENLY